MKGKKKIIIFSLLFTGLSWLYGCGSPSSDLDVGAGGQTQAESAEVEKAEEQAESGIAAKAEVQEEAVLVYESSMELCYAENFTVDYYEGGYTMLTTTMDGERFLLVPENGGIPGGLEEDITVLYRPVQDIYLVASSAMDMFAQLGSMDAIAFSGQKEDGWYIEAARDAMANGDRKSVV